MTTSARPRTTREVAEMCGVTVRQLMFAVVNHHVVDVAKELELVAGAYWWPAGAVAKVRVHFKEK